MLSFWSSHRVWLWANVAPWVLQITKSRVINIFQYADHYGWSQGCVSFASLAELDIRSYLKNNQIISKKDDDKIIMNEKNLLANRLLRKEILVQDSMHICPKHRSSFGIDWFNKKTTCHHPEHDSSSSASMKDCRVAKLASSLKIEEFPIGGRYHLPTRR